MITSARLLLISLLACCFSIPSYADVVYSFDYTAVSGPVQSFAFSLTTPTFITGDSSPALTPFTPTDGVHTFTITKDLVSAGGCFMFGTPYATLSGPPPFECSVAAGGPGYNQGGFIVDTMKLPAAPGRYGPEPFIGGFDASSGFEYIESSPSPFFQKTGVMSLTVTEPSVPEPAALSSLVIGFCAVWGLWAVKRKSRHA